MKPTIFISNRTITFEMLNAILAKEQESGWIENLWLTNCRVIDVPNSTNPLTLFSAYQTIENGIAVQYPVFMGYRLRGKCILENNVFSSAGI